MNAAYLTEFARGRQLLRAVPELSGVGFAETGFRVAPKESVGMARAVIGQRAGQSSEIHSQWVKHMANALKKRRDEFKLYRRARMGPMMMSATMENLFEFAKKLDEDYHPVKGTLGAAFIPGIAQTGIGLGTLAASVTPKTVEQYRVGNSFLPGRAQDANVLEKLRERASRAGAKIHKSSNIFAPAFAWDHGVSKASVTPVQTLTGSQDVKGVALSPHIRASLRPGILAHEVGHLEGPSILRNVGIRKASTIGTGLGALYASGTGNEKHARVAAAAGAAAFLPTIASEVDASIRGVRMLRQAGVRGPKSLVPALGLASYGAVAASPYASYKIKKALGGYRKSE